MSRTTEITPPAASRLKRVSGLQAVSAVSPDLLHDADETRDRLADALQGIIAQRLLPRADGQGRVLAAEVLIATGSVRETIKRPMGNPPLKELMESGGDMYGMQTFEMHIKQLVREGYLERDVARAAMGF